MTEENNWFSDREDWAFTTPEAPSKSKKFNHQFYDLFLDVLLLKYILNG